MFFPNKYFVDLLEYTDDSYTNFRLRNISFVDHNLLGIDILTLGPIHAYKIASWPNYWYCNKVLFLDSLNENNIDKLHDIDIYFSNSDLSYRIELAPYNLRNYIGKKIHKICITCSGFNTVLIRSISFPSMENTNNDISIRRLTNDNDIDVFLDTYQDAFGYYRFNPEEKLYTKSWCSPKHAMLMLYGAYIKNILVGIATMYISDKVAIMADAATLPDYRGKGIHKKFIKQRLQDANECGCEIATSYVEFGSNSHINLVKEGFETFYTISMWTKA